jgi:PAS domain S-box-containing protein
MKRVPSMKRRKRILAKTSVKGVQALMARELKQSSEELELQNLTLINSQNELELSRERYADLYDAAPVSFVTLTRSGLIVDINLPAVRVLGRNRNRLVGSPFLNFVVRSDQRTFLTHLSRCRRNLEQNKPLSVELELTRKSGEPQLFIELISTPSAGKRPESTTYKSIFIDITDRKHQEANGPIAPKTIFWRRSRTNCGRRSIPYCSWRVTRPVTRGCRPTCAGISI